MTTRPAEDPHAWFTGWAAADPDAVVALAAWSLPRLHAKMPAHDGDAVAEATRRVLHTTPPFAVADPARAQALLERLVAHELETTHEAVRRPLPPLAPAPLLDLDRGRDDEPGRGNARRKLALLLMPPRDRKLLLAAWSGLDDAAVASRLGTSDGCVARDRERCERTLEQVVQHLELGAIEAALSTAVPSAPDAWGSATQWSMVLGAVATDDPGRVHASWRRLLERYEAPIRRAIRRAHGDDARGDELTAEFFSYLFEHAVLAKVQPRGGRFRAYIQAVLRNFLHRQRRRGRPVLELDETNSPATAAADRDAEQADELEWARHVLHLALQQLFADRERDGEILVRYYGLAWPDPQQPRSADSRESIAARFGLSLGAVDQATYRARRALRAQIERELRETVDGAEAMNAEVEMVASRLLQAYPGLL
ncbi:MAG: sigma-70 family RNA polymerase sigma factor [Planctomycetota bacterium]